MPPPPPHSPCSFEKLFQRRGMCRCCKLPEQSNFFFSLLGAGKSPTERAVCFQPPLSDPSRGRPAMLITWTLQTCHTAKWENKTFEVYEFNYASVFHYIWRVSPSATAYIRHFSLRGYISFTVSYLQIDPSKLNWAQGQLVILLEIAVTPPPQLPHPPTHTHRITDLYCKAAFCASRLLRSCKGLENHYLLLDGWDATHTDAQLHSGLNNNTNQMTQKGR